MNVKQFQKWGMSILDLESRGKRIMAKSLRELIYQNHGVTLEGDMNSFRWIRVLFEGSNT